MTPKEIAEIRTDLLSFVKCMFKARNGTDFIENWHHREICNVLERVLIGDIKRLIINLPPRYSKTELAVVNFISWCMGNFPDCEFIHVSYAKTLATTNAWKVRNIMQHEAYASIFGAPKFCDDSNAKDHFNTLQGGCVYATGAGGTITGFGAGKMRDVFGGAIIIDDIHKADEANSPSALTNTIEWFDTTLYSRLNNKNTPIIAIGQRLNEADLLGWLSAGGNGEKWDVLKIPAINDVGEPLWSHKHDMEDLRRMEKSNPYVFAGQYMQEPAPRGGGLFKEEWWHYYDILPSIKNRIIVADTAQKTKEMNDYTVLQCWGVGTDGKSYLLDQLRGKYEAPELLLNARAFWNKHKATQNQGALRGFYIEDKSSGTGLIQTLKRDQGSLIPIIPIKRGTADKITRANDVINYIASGYVVLPRHADFLVDLLKELSHFPNAKHDDMVDVLVDAVGITQNVYNKRISYAGA